MRVCRIALLAAVCVHASLAPAEQRPLRVEEHATELRIVTDDVEAVVTPRTGQVAFLRPHERTPFLVATRHQFR